MFNLLGNKKLNPFGLDISERTIKVVQLAKQKNGYSPSALARVDIPNNLINNHVITNEEKLAVLVSKAVTAARHLNSNYAVVNVPEAKSFVRIVTLPKMELAEIDTALPWELEQDIPVPIEQVYMDWQLVEETEDKIKVLAVASPKEYIDSMLTVLKMAKLKPVAFELESKSTARAAIGVEDKDQSVILVDISSTLTSFAVVSKEILEYTSSIATGGNAITDGIAQALGVPPKEAEQLKTENGLLADASKKGNVRQNIIPVLDSIIDEVRNVIKYHEDHSLFKQPITKVILCGGGAKLKGIGEYVMARLNVGAGKSVGHVLVCDPWTNVASPNNRAGFPDPDDSQEYTTAVGLALRGITIDENH
jgi:type IV pilus assembly protein PilM